MGKGGGIGVAAARVWVSLGWWGGGGVGGKRIVFGDCQIICCIIYASCF